MTEEDRVRTAIEDYCGEGWIAFPEARESAERCGLDHDDAVSAARDVLSDLFQQRRLTVHQGRALDSEMPEVDEVTARELLAANQSFDYGSGDEIRAWFVIPDC